jgi:heptosyltransferase III
MSTVKTLLFITSNRLGDGVLSTGLLDVAIERFAPDAVTVVCGAVPAVLFTHVPKLANIIPMQKEKHDLHWLKLWLKLLPHRWDVVIDIRDSAVSYVLNAGTVYRFRNPDRTKVKAEQLADILKLPKAPFNRVWLSDADRAEAKAFLPEGEPILALCPRAAWGPKTWPAERFIETAQRLPFKRVAIFGAAQEREFSLPVIGALSKTHEVIDMCGKTNPLQAAACLERVALCIANDSGLMHIAAAVNAPTLGLFGPSPDWEYRPWGPRATFVRAAPYLGKDKTPDPFALMQAISVDRVVDEATKIIS